MDLGFMTEFLSTIDWKTILPMGGMFWFFYSRLNGKMERGFDKIDQRFESMDKKLSDKIDKLDDKVTDIDRRVCRMEGSMAVAGFPVYESERFKEKVK